MTKFTFAGFESVFIVAIVLHSGTLAILYLLYIAGTNLNAICVSSCCSLN